MHRTLVLFALFAVLSFTSFSQPLKMEALHRIIMYKNDTVFRFYTYPLKKKIKMDENANYHWYQPDTILITKGGYDKKLLNGEFTVFYPNQNLKEKGLFAQGTKKGKWMSWYADGRMQTVVNWNKGLRQGYFEYYDSSGAKTQSGFYKNDLLSGDIVEYLSDGKSKTVKYKDGVPVIIKAVKDSLPAAQPNEIKN